MTKKIITFGNITGLQSLTVISLEFDQLLPHTNAKEPILIIISPGIDPSEELRSFAKANVGSKFREVSNIEVAI